MSSKKYNYPVLTDKLSNDEVATFALKLLCGKIVKLCRASPEKKVNYKLDGFVPLFKRLN